MQILVIKAVGFVIQRVNSIFLIHLPFLKIYGFITILIEHLNCQIEK